MKKVNPQSLPIVKNFGRKNYGTVGGQVLGLSDTEEHDYEAGVRPSPPMGVEGKKKKKRRR